MGEAFLNLHTYGLEQLFASTSQPRSINYGDLARKGSGDREARDLKPVGGVKPLRTMMDLSWRDEAGEHPELEDVSGRQSRDAGQQT